MQAIARSLILALVLCLWQTLPAQNGSVRELSLDEALQIASEANYQMQIARSQVSQAEGQSLESWSGFLPSVTLSENYMKSNDPVTVFSLKLKQGIFTQQDFDLARLNDPASVDNFTTMLQVQQPLLNLDAIYGKSAASLAVQAREQALNRTEQAVALQVKTAYYGLILTRESLAAIEQAVASATAHRDDARVAYEQGLINLADYLSAEVRLAELEEHRITAQHQVVNASDGLKFVLGLQDEALIVPSDSLAVSQIATGEVEVDAAVAARSDVRATEMQHRAARRNLWMKRSSWIPRLNGFGAVEWNASEAFSKDASSWAVGLQLQWQIFQGLGDFGRAKHAAAQAQEVEVQVRQVEERARMEIRKSERALQAARQRLSVAASAVEQAEISHSITNERFKQGLEKTADLLDKEVALTNTRLRFLKAKHDVAVADGELQFALGR